jgi:hypothetical protein
MPFTNIENCIIKPHERFSEKPNYPGKVIICHHHSYIKAARELAKLSKDIEIIEDWEHTREFRILLKYKGIPIILDNTRDNAEETASHVVEHFFWAENPLEIINVSSAGSLQENISIGDALIGEKAIRDNKSVHNLADDSESAVSSAGLVEALDASPKKRKDVKIHRGNIWSNGNMYYTWDRLQEILKKDSILATETEMEAICIVLAWLNYNYSQIRDAKPEGKAGNLFYISDILPRTKEEKWVDTMNNMALLYPFKVSSLLWAIDTLASFSASAR